MVPASENTLYNETKKAVYDIRMKPLFFSEKLMYFILPNEIYDLSCQKPFGDQFSAPLKIMSVNRDKHVSVEWFALKPDW